MQGYMEGVTGHIECTDIHETIIKNPDKQEYEEEVFPDVRKISARRGICKFCGSSLSDPSHEKPETEFCEQNPSAEVAGQS